MKLITLSEHEATVAYQKLRQAYTRAEDVYSDATQFPDEFEEGAAAEAEAEMVTLQAMLDKLAAKEST